ncbi:M20 family metallopeptidase [Benzoatithermus flavus]|uniref:M20 family metallopeptidase n=1 Tax=Benzoatithermus flavus TaxID=3108223 RepID=A0ABU8XMM9_9PROT
MSLSTDAIDLTRRLLRLDTINPPGGEEAAIALLGGLLEAAGFTTRRVDLAPGRPNLIARLSGSDPDAPALGLTGHVDIVPLGEAPWRHDPFAGETDGDRLYGRGSADMKSGVAAMVVAALAVAREKGRRAGLELVLTAGEETGCAGAKRIVETPRTLGRVGALVVGEPTGLSPGLGHRGVIWLRFHFKGRSAHASMPHEGDNAVLKAARAAVRLAHHDFGGACHHALGRPTLNLGRIEGGCNLNSVPDRAVLGIDIRPIPGQTSAAIVAELSALCPEAEIEILSDCPPLWSAGRDDWLAQVMERTRAVTGRAVDPAPVPFATDAGFLAPAYGGVPTVILGPGETEQAHKTDEWCSLTRIGQAAELYRDLAAAWCR